MEVNKLIITSQTGHFGKIFGYDDRYTYKSPPPSTVLGILQVIYGIDIDNFIFGYIFQSDEVFRDDILIHQRNKEGKLVNKSNIKFIELHYNCKLTIYTNINQDIKMDYMLCMGKSGHIAKLHLPIKKIELINKQGQGYNQYTPKHIGSGRIQTYNMLSQYDDKFDSYEHQVEQLRFNEVFNYNKYYDEEEKQNIFLWQINNKKVMPYDD